MAKNYLSGKYSVLLEAWEQEAYTGGYGADWLEEAGESIRVYAMDCENSGKRPTFLGLIQYLKILHDGAAQKDWMRLTNCVNRIVPQKTNADRIRAMSDKELAIALVKYEGTEKLATQYGGHEHIFWGPNGEKCGTKAYAIELWEKWLKQPAEETDDGLL